MGIHEIVTVVEATPEHPRHDSASIVELLDGRLMIAWMEHVGGKLIGHDHSPCNIASMVSHDVGYTWGGPQDHHVAGCHFSDDDGRSWVDCENWVDLPLRGAMEPHVAELRDGRLLMHLRTQLGAVFYSLSDDGGVSWSAAQTTGLRAPESMPCLTRIPTSGDLLLVWNPSLYDPVYDHFGKRTPLSVAVSGDDGVSWEHVKSIEDDPAWEYTNPACHFTSRGTVLIHYIASPMDEPEPPGRLGRSRVHLKSLIADIDWLYEPC